MSTDYMCYAEGNDLVTLYEHSGKLDLAVECYGVEDGAMIKDMTPEEVARMAIKMLKAAWYQDENAVQTAIDESRNEYTMGLKL